MPEITVNVGVCVRADGGGTGHNWDRTSLNAVQQLFKDPIRLGRDAESYTVRVTSFSIPRGFTGTMSGRNVVKTDSEPLNPAKESDVKAARKAFKFDIQQGDLAGVDLIYIPGAAAATPTQRTDRYGMQPDDSRKQQEAETRDEFEKKVIAKAMSMGIPVLAVCAGSWRLLEAFGGSVRELTSEEVVKHHLTAFDVTAINQIEDETVRKETRKERGAQMLAAAKVKYADENASVWNLSHQLRVHDGPGGAIRSSATKAAGTLLGTRGGLPGENLVLDGANSTHWAVGDASASTRDKVGTIAKRAYPDTVSPHDQRDPSQLLQVVASDPDTGAMEGFETIHGVPMVGAQWHPEGYLEGQPGNGMPYTKPGIVAFSRNLFHYMVLAAVTAKLHKANVVNQLRAGAARLKNVPESEKRYRETTEVRPR